MLVSLPSTSNTKYLDASLSQFTSKICIFRFPWLCQPKREWATFPSTSGLKKPYMFYSPQPHDRKYFDPSLSQFTPKICWFLFPQLTSPPENLWAMFPSASCLKNHSCFQPCWPITIWAMFPLALGFKNHTFFVQSHNTKYFDPSLCQSTLKICRFRFPQPRWPKNKWVSFLSALQPPKKIPLPSAP